ncbi:aminoacyl-tRNA hydrolase [Lutispora sp.]|uniref:aminoacyl-tRNA hydrolase n=1 Tax=Lutispora sp. TaxID=2828727 RepID=UPI000EC74EE7|nr:aminoacyl-tRNA hydrolase [Lutispora sp.]MEA4961280.1 aminoacyl-tRNA hydrolase [Lutispora sp.]HCJ57847.1 aminoacyl-tRNA hydrolase [Clostridiaceae bacterium]
MFVIAGLGNPGARYADTRHNIGFIAVDYLSRQLNININKIRHKALVGEGYIGTEKVVLIKPQTYMNLSGESIMDVVGFYKLPSENLIVIYDDVDLSPGVLRIRPKGSSGSHNGMKSIIYLLNRDDFPRIRIGIGKQPEYMDLADYVTGKFSKEEIPIMTEAVEKAADAAQEIVLKGIAAAMNKFNG